MDYTVKPNLAATPQQAIDMDNFRAYIKDKYTNQFPTSISFMAEVELFESQIRKHWSREDAKTIMAFLVDCSWSCTAPYEFLKEQVPKLLMAIEIESATLEILDEAGLFDTVIPCYPVHNDPKAPSTTARIGQGISQLKQFSKSRRPRR